MMAIGITTAAISCGILLPTQASAAINLNLDIESPDKQNAQGHQGTQAIQSTMAAQVAQAAQAAQTAQATRDSQDNPTGSSAESSSIITANAIGGEDASVLASQETKDAAAPALSHDDVKNVEMRLNTPSLSAGEMAAKEAQQVAAQTAFSSNHKDANDQAQTNNSLIAQPKERVIYRDAYGNRVSKPVTESTDPQSLLATTAAGTTSAANSNTTITTTATDQNGTAPHNYASKTAMVGWKDLRVAVVYLSQPERVPHNDNDVDELTGASVIFDDYGRKRGNMDYVSDIIASELGAKTFELTRVRPYPDDHDELIYQASLELDLNEHPKIAVTPIFNVDDFDVVFIGYPIWWYDLPMPFYTFFLRYDLSGKIIIPFCSHGGSRPYKTFEVIRQLEPNAHVAYDQGLVIDRIDIPYRGKSIIHSWLQALKQAYEKGDLMTKLTQNNSLIAAPSVTSAFPVTESETETSAESGNANDPSNAGDAGNAGVALQ